MKVRLKTYCLRQKKEILQRFLCATTAITVYEMLRFSGEKELWIDVGEEEVDVPPLALIATPIKSDDERSVKYSVIRFYDGMIRTQLEIPLDYPDIEEFFHEQEYWTERIERKRPQIIDPSQIKTQ